MCIAPESRRAYVRIVRTRTVVFQDEAGYDYRGSQTRATGPVAFPPGSRTRAFLSWSPFSVMAQFAARGSEAGVWWMPISERHASTATPEASIPGRGLAWGDWALARGGFCHRARRSRSTGTLHRRHRPRAN